MAATALLLWKKDAVRSWGMSTFLRAVMLVLQKTPEKGKQLASALFSGGTTVKLKQRRPLLNTHATLAGANSAVHGILCAPEAVLGDEGINLICWIACGGGFVEGSRIWM